MSEDAQGCAACAAFRAMRIPPGVRTARVTCCGAPVQIEGELDDGRAFYFRSRHMLVTLCVGPAGSSAEALVAAGPSVERVLRPTEDGDDEHAASWISPDETTWLLGEMVEELA